LARRAAALGEVPVGAVVYRGRAVLGEAHNLREASHDPAGHAEMLALRQAAARLGRWRLSGCSIAVTLEPCPMCAGALVNARLDRLVYGAVDPKAGACTSLYAIPTDPRLNHRLETTGGVLARECGAILSGFFRARRRQAALLRGARRPGSGERPSARPADGGRP
ncbi:MAG: tRNA adenosine(34) deaminase TadA, partial [Phycisphaerales bacterium]|nr:tRNA adenosine(34) deaminase TadA [Phycisphaerales bacterium]